MNDTVLNLTPIQSEASMQRAAAFGRLLRATGRFMARPFRRDTGQAA